MKRLTLLLIVTALVFTAAAILPTQSASADGALPAPLNVTVQKSGTRILLTWSAVEENYGYNIKVDGVDVGNAATDAVSFEVTALLTEAKAYSLAVAALDENAAPCAYTTISFDHYIELSAPTSLSVTSGVLHWTDDNVGIKYAVFARGIKIGDNIAEKQFNLSDLLAYCGTFDICVQAKASGNYVMSKVSEPYSFTNYVRLSSPVGASVAAVDADKVLSWNKTFGASAYDVVIDKSNGTNVLTETVTENSIIITDYVADVSDYTIKLTAKGGGYYSDSEVANLSYSTNATLSAPVLSRDGTPVSWTAVPNALSYSVSVNGVPKATELTGTSFDFAPFVTTAGSYRIAVQANSNGNYLQSAIASVVYETYSKLSAPILTLSDSTLSWGAVQNAVNYTVKIDGDVITNLQTALFIDLSSYCAEVRDYAISVFANANGFYTVSDAATTTYSVTAKLATPTLELDEKTANWSAVFGATSYTVKVDGEVIDSACTATTYDLSASLTEASHVIAVFANGIGNFTASDEATANYADPSAAYITVTNKSGGTLGIRSTTYAVYVAENTYLTATLTDLQIDSENRLTGNDTALLTTGSVVVIVQTDTATASSILFVEAFTVGGASTYALAELAMTDCEELASTSPESPYKTEGEGIYEAIVNGNVYYCYVNADGDFKYNLDMTKLARQYTIVE